MKNTYSIYNRNNNLYVRLMDSKSGIDKKLSLNIKLKSDCFIDYVSRRAYGDEIQSAIINRTLSKWDAHFYENFNLSPQELINSWIENTTEKAFFMKSEKPTLIGLYFDMYQKMKEGQIQNLKGAGKFHYNTLKKYRATGHVLRSFSHDVLVEEVDEGNYTNHRDRLNCRRKVKDFYNSFIKHSIEKGYAVGTRDTQLKNIKSLISKGCEYYAYQIYAFKIPTIKYDEVIALEPEHVEMIHKTKPDEKKLIRTWYYTRLILHSGMRVSNMGNFETTLGEGYIDMKDLKTQHASKFYLPKEVREYIYYDKKPKWTTKDFREKLKTLLKYYPEFHEMRLVYKTNYIGELEKISKPIYEWITPHKLRSSAISWYLSLGYTEKQVREISGHADGSHAFYRYTAKTDERTRKAHAEQIENLLKVCQ